MFDLPENVLYQSQLTTITKAADRSIQRTRTAQGFQAFNPVSFIYLFVILYFLNQLHFCKPPLIFILYIV